MVDNLHALDAVFHALADPTRRAILHRLSAGACNVGELAEPFAISLAAASKHIKVLESAGLLRREVRGRTHLCSLEAAPMHAGQEWLRHYEQFWNRSLDALEAALQAERPSRKPRRKK
jgi:DNA-binding transcriptional ArsR family regulator